MRVAILGTGKMARDMGSYYLSRGCDLIVASTDAERLESIFGEMSKRHRRLAGAAHSTSAVRPPKKSLLGVDPPAFADIVIETTTESLEAKRAVLGAAKPLLDAARVKATNSSSFLPSELREGMVGAHHFFPVALTGIVEIVADGGSDPKAVEEMRDFARTAELCAIDETASNAFAVNRLLLPLQNEAFRALRRGIPAFEVDSASASSLCALGQPSLLDAIGIDVVAASVERYCERMSRNAADSLAELRAGLAELLAAGKLGKKSSDGLLVGAPLPWRSCGEGAPFSALGPRMRAVFINTCARFLEASALSSDALDLALERVYGAETTLLDALEKEGGESVRRLLESAYADERLDYLRPSALLSH